MRTKNLITLFWQFLGISFLLIASACVPKVTEKKANCGTDQIFNSVTRECVNAQVVRYVPEGLTSSMTVTEGTIQTFNLQYKDKENDRAKSCMVSEADTKIEVFSPKMAEAETETKKLVEFLQLAVQVHNAQLPASTHIAVINAKMATINSDYEGTKYGYSISSVVPFYENIYTEAIAIYDTIKAFSASSTMTYYNNVVRDQIEVAKPFIQGAINRCYCDSAGVCSVRAGVVGQSSGLGLFSYTINDGIDGSSMAKSVSVTIVNTNDAPFAPSYSFTFSESASVTASSYAVSFPTGYDPEGQTLTPIVVSGPTNGTLSGCNSSGCTYTPTSGDANNADAPTQAYVDFYGVRYTLHRIGTWGNSLKVHFKEQANEERRFLQSGIYADVSLPDITFYVPENYVFPPSELESFIDSHPMLSLLGDALDISGSAQTYTGLPNTYSFANGLGGFDSFTFKYRDSAGKDSVVATMAIQVTPTNDPPRPRFVTANPAWQIARNGTVSNPVAYSNLQLYNADDTLYYTDPDATVNLATQCKVSFTNFTPSTSLGLTTTTVPSQAELGTCTCNPADGKCSFEIRSTYRTSPGNVNVYYAFYDGSNWSTTTQAMPVTILPDNVAPSFFGIGAVLASLNEDAALTTLITAPLFANDGVANDSEIISGSMQQTLQYSMLVESLVNPSLYNSASLSDNFEVYYETCTPACTEVKVTTSTSLTNYITLGTGTGVTNLDKNLKVKFKPSAEQSGQFRITLRLKDISPYAGETSELSTDWVSGPITVNNVNDPPVIYDTDVKALVTAAGSATEVTISTVETAESSQVLTRTFLVDEGGDDAENADEVAIASIASDNTTLVPLNNIEPIFDRDGDGLYENSGVAANDEVYNATDAYPIYLEDTNDEDAKKAAGMLVGRKLLFKITPTPGNFGIANIRFKLSDNGTGSPQSDKTYIIAVVVHPISTIHGGWTHLEATGLKLKKDASSLTHKFTCAKERTSGTLVYPNDNSLEGTGAPNGVVTSGSYDLQTYWDNTYQNCYYSQQDSSPNHWYSLNTYCPMSKTCKLSTTDTTSNTRSCLFDSNPAPASYLDWGLKEDDVYGVINTSTQEVTCYRVNNSVGVQYYPTNVTLAWKAFSVSTSSSTIVPVLTSYRIFRKTLGEEYNLSKPLATISASKLSYTDTTAFGGTAYHYKIVPVVTFDGKEINVFPTENFSQVRMVAPPANYTFVHRWMVNQEVCNKLGYTVSMSAPNRVDPTNNYRCPYSGPGQSSVAPGYYDIDRDYLVDSVENGCPFTETSSCVLGGSNAACVGIQAQPDSVAAAGTIYYSRSSGQCLYSTGGAWIDFDAFAASGVALGTKQVVAQRSISNFNPPISNITKANADSFCALRPNVTINTATTTATTGFSLPTRKEQVAFFAGPMEKQSSNDSYNEYADSSIQTIENGQSLNNNNHCNSNFANGLDLSFVDTDYPPSSLLYTLPGNQSSAIRSLVTGSVAWGDFKGTTQCVSRYGLQDVYGNVSEWVKDDFQWSGTNYIQSNSTGLQFDYDGSGGGAATAPYRFDYLIGPCNDSDTSGSCTSADTMPTSEWDISERNFGATLLALPVALPFSEQYKIIAPYPTSTLIPYLLDIGKASGGISSAALHSDRFIMNTNTLGAGGVTMSTGGSYSSGNTSGRYSFKLHQSTEKSAEIGFRCVSPLPANY